MSAALVARDIRADYQGSAALRGVDVQVRPGEMVGVLGSQGAGKTTLVNAIAGWSRGRPKVSGTVHLEAVDIGVLPPHERVRRGLLLVPEGTGVFSRLTVAEHLDLAARAQAAGRRFAADEIFELFPALHRRRGHKGSQLSGGERQMLAVSRALRAGPRLLMLDEPSIGLAPRALEDLLARLRRLADGGLPLLLVEQNARAALASIDRGYVLERGRVVRHGVARELRDDPRVIQAYVGSLTPERR